jgi:hypothetical protein
MALNKNHEFEELNGVKCGIVEEECQTRKSCLLKEILEFNKLTVIVVPSPHPKLLLPQTGCRTADPATPQTANAEPQTPNPQPETPNPNPKSKYRKHLP